jgi:hypothetical protein
MNSLVTCKFKWWCSWEVGNFFYLLAPSQIVTTKGSKWAGCYENCVEANWDVLGKGS